MAGKGLGLGAGAGETGSTRGAGCSGPEQPTLGNRLVRAAGAQVGRGSLTPPSISTEGLDVLRGGFFARGSRPAVRESARSRDLRRTGARKLNKPFNVQFRLSACSVGKCWRGSELRRLNAGGKSRGTTKSVQLEVAAGWALLGIVGRGSLTPPCLSTQGLDGLRGVHVARGLRPAVARSETCAKLVGVVGDLRRTRVYRSAPNEIQSHRRARHSPLANASFRPRLGKPTWPPANR
jgi:hypothetical protein